MHENEFLMCFFVTEWRGKKEENFHTLKKHMNIFFSRIFFPPYVFAHKSSKQTWQCLNVQMSFEKSCVEMHKHLREEKEGIFFPLFFLPFKQKNKICNAYVMFSREKKANAFVNYTLM